jgi:hypothetical protein
MNRKVFSRAACVFGLSFVMLAPAAWDEDSDKRYDHVSRQFVGGECLLVDPRELRGSGDVARLK